MDGLVGQSIKQGATTETDEANTELRSLVQNCLRRWYLKAEAYVHQRPLLPEFVVPGQIAIEARRTRRCRRYLVGAASFDEDGDSDDAECLDVCRIFVSETQLVHYTKRSKPLQPQPSTMYHGLSASSSEGPPVDDKYWKRRFNYFSRFDEGIRMDAAAWFEVTPESVARHIADRLPYQFIVDGTCGIGGNAIQFAMTSDRVIAVDIDEVRLQDSAHNAELYGVRERIRFVCDDFVSFARNYDGEQPDAVFLSPPWGGPAHLDADYFSVKDVECIVNLFTAAAGISPRVVLYLPRHIDVHEIVILAASHGFREVEVEKVFFQYPTPHLKLVIVYFTVDPTDKAVSTVRRSKAVGASARGVARGDRRLLTRRAAEAAIRGNGRVLNGSEATLALVTHGLTGLPPLYGPILRSLYCRFHYIGRYAVAAAVMIDRSTSDQVSRMRGAQRSDVALFGANCNARRERGLDRPLRRQRRD